MSCYLQKIGRVRAQLASEGAAGAVLSTPDNIFYATGFSSVMDGWHLVEPIAAVFVPTDAASPVVLILPEASVISPIVLNAVAPGPLRPAGHLRHAEFRETARAEDAHLALPEDLLGELGDLMELVESQCEPDIIQTIAASLSRHVAQDELILFDDLRVAARVAAFTGQASGDALDVMFAARSVKTDDELDTLRESGQIADAIMAYTISQLGVGKSWGEVEKQVAHFMIDHDVDPLPGSPMLFGGAYDLVFRPDLFRTPVSRPFEGGEIAILETQGRYKNFWIDINRTAHIGPATPAYRDQFNAVRDIFDTISTRLAPGVNSGGDLRFP